MKCSIITATYNSSDTVLDAVNSIISQSFENIEPVIIDGASKDDTVSVIEEAYKKSKITPIIVSEPDKGIYDALNKGIERSTGDVIAFLHADDLYSDVNVIQKVMDCFEQSGVDSVYGDLTYVQKDNTDKVIRYWESGSYTVSDLEKGWMPPHPSFFVKRNLYKKFGSFDTSFRIAADYDFMMRILFKEKVSSQYLPEVLVKMRVGGESNRSLKNLIQKSKEDLRAMRNNDLGGFLTLSKKNLRKIPQFFKRSKKVVE